MGTSGRRPLLRAPLSVVLGAAPFVASYALLRVVSVSAFFVMLPLLAPIYMPLMTPLLRRIGFFRYHSPFLLSIPAWGARELHLGTSFDRMMHGLRAPKDILVLVCDGLLAIADEVTNGKLDPETRLVATSHFFTARTARSLGFDVRDASYPTILLNLVGWVDVLFWTSIVRRRPSWVSPLTLKTARATAGDITARADHVRTLRARLRAK